MDFFCQRCGKTVDVDDSLLRIDLPMGDLARGDVDLDRVLASNNNNKFSRQTGSQRLSYNTAASVVSASSLAEKPNPRVINMSSSSFFAPRKVQQTESPIPKALAGSYIAKPSKTTTILLKNDKPPTNLSTTPNSHSPTTPPSPNATATSTTPTKASPPNYSQSLQPASHFPPNYGQANALTKSRSEIINPLRGSSDAVPNGKTDPRSKYLAQSQTVMSQSAIFSPTYDTPYGSVGSFSGLKYIRDKRVTRKVSEMLGEQMASSMIQASGYTSAPNIQHLSAAPPAAANSISLADAMSASRLFQLVSEQIGIDLPLCSECTKTLTTDLDEELGMMENQNNSYMYCLDQLEQKEKKWPPCSDIEDEINRLEEEEKELREQIASLHQQKRQVNSEVVRLKKEASKLINFEERYWQNFDELHATLSAFLDERDACKVQTANTREQLRRTQRTQIINDAFHIWHDGHFGTVNSFRLGRLPSQPVDWNEINAAWGLATLLLYNMARRIDFKFSTYRLVPSGSCSKMERIDNGSTYELFGSSDISLGRLFWYRRFDNGMVAFLLCLKEMGDFAEQRDKSFHLPHKMEKDKVGDMSIKIQFNNEETWTKSLKYTLTNLKWLLAWVVRMEAEQVAAKHSKGLTPGMPSGENSGNNLSNVPHNNNNNTNNNNPYAHMNTNNNNNNNPYANMNNNNNNPYANMNNNNNNTNNNNTSIVNNTNSINNPPASNPPPQRSRLTLLFSRSNTTQ